MNSSPCSNCQMLFHSVEMGKPGGAPAISNTQCADKRCGKQLCRNSQQFVCEGCGKTFCRAHLSRQIESGIEHGKHYSIEYQLCPACAEPPEPECTCTQTDVDQFDSRGCELHDRPSGWNDSSLSATTRDDELPAARGQADSCAEFDRVRELNDAIDQMSSEARDAEGMFLGDEVKKLLNLAWWFTEKAIRETTGACSAGCDVGRMGHSQGRKFCPCCHHFRELTPAAERVRRLGI